MTAVELVHMELKRLHKMLDGSLNGLTADQLHTIPGGNPDAASSTPSLIVRSKAVEGRPAPRPAIANPFTSSGMVMSMSLRYSAVCSVTTALRPGKGELG